MNDELIKAICFNDSARIYICSVKNIANTIGDNFSFFPSPLDALARVLSVGAMMAGKLKNDMRITIRVDGDGPVGKIIVEGNAKGEMAGYVENPHCHLEYNNLTLNVEDTVGRNGFISVITRVCLIGI